MRRIVSVLTVLAVMAAMVLALTVPAFAKHQESHIGGGTPEDKVCDTDALTTTCHGGGGGRSACDPETNECLTSEGFGGHGTIDWTTGDYTTSGGFGGTPIAYDENGLPYNDPGGSGYHCEGNGYTGEQDCVGKGYTGGSV